MAGTLARHEIVLDEGGGNEVVLECLPFRWPRGNWETLDLEINRETGWAMLNSAALDKLLALYNNAHGQILQGLAGLIVQYVEGTGHDVFRIRDWQGNSGGGVFVPDDGLDYDELHGTATEDDPTGSAYHTARMKFVLVAP